MNLRPVVQLSRSPESILAFWFKDGEDRSTREYIENGMRRWFYGEDLMFDIAQWGARDLIDWVATAEEDPCWTTPSGILASVILFDQFPRCAFRGTRDAFAYESRAISSARRAVETGAFDSYLPIERFFVAMALSHSEDIGDNALHVELAGRLSMGASDEVVSFFQDLPGWPDEHFNTIKRFGRFPHRNRVHGRSSTAEEISWLEGPECPGWARSQTRAKLTYWDGRGLGDPIRFMLEFCLVPYDEKNVTTRSAFLDLRDSGSLSFGQVPLLEMDGLQMVQTQAILRYLAGKKGLDGATSVGRVRADMAVNAILDIRLHLITARFQADKEKALQNFREKALPKFAGQMEEWLGRYENQGPYICGAMVTYADVCLLEMLAYAADECPETEDFLAQSFSRVAALFRIMKEGFPNMQAYLLSPRRKKKPDDAFVRTVCAILDMSLPAYLEEEPPQNQSALN